MSILIGIQSCWAHRDRHQAMRDTWIKDLPPEVQYYFFIGEREFTKHYIDLKDDERVLHCPDDYNSLSMKTQKMCEWAFKNDYDFMFKCDTDTYINVENLLAEDFSKMRWVYVGGENEDVTPDNLRSCSSDDIIQFCSGGAGYWLDRACLQLVREHVIIPTCAEDVYVAKILRDVGVHPTFRPGYLWRPDAPKFAEGTVTVHFSSVMQKKYDPEMMYLYKEFKNAAA